MTHSKRLWGGGGYKPMSLAGPRPAYVLSSVGNGVPIRFRSWVGAQAWFYSSLNRRHHE